MAAKHYTADPGFLSDFSGWLRRAVFLQDAGAPVGEDVSKLVGLSCSHQLMIAIDIERRRMVHEGLQVQAQPTDNSGFIIGFPQEKPPEPSSAS